ncbi:MAG: hypothetical protein R6U96_15460 [Promethearchaeia archaeon]
MTSKKKIVGLFVVGTLLVAGIIPLFIMASGADVNISFSLTSTEPTSSSITTQASDVEYNVEDLETSAKERDLNLYEQFIANGNDVNAEDKESSGQAVAEIEISLELITPSGKNRTFSIEPRELEGTGQKEIKTTLGPNELNEETGTFELIITIKIKVTPPTFDEPVLDKTLNPVNTTFEVPA